MQLLIIITCRGCGATLVPITADTAWLHSDQTSQLMDDAIERHRQTASACPYYLDSRPGKPPAPVHGKPLDRPQMWGK